ncbi:MAG: sporulation integral membrane protein YtvI [Lachnospiraceae bacterium]|nr:sporulation integral membrane protein YtvI [Lachnospiraceae bacterium]
MGEKETGTVRYYVRILLNIVIPIIAVVLVCTVGVAAVRFFLPFVIGWVIAMIANPLVRFLDKKVRILRSFSSIAIIVVVLGGTVAILWALVAWMSRQMIDLTENLPALKDAVQTQIDLLQLRLGGFLDTLPFTVKLPFPDSDTDLIDYVAKYVGNLGEILMPAAGNFVSSIPSALIYFIVTLLSSYFFLVDKDIISRKVSEHLPSSFQRTMVEMKDRAGRLVGGYFFAQLKIMCLIYGILVIGFLILGVQYSGLIALLVAVLDFLPVFGTGTVLLPWAVIELILGKYVPGVGMLVLYGVTQLSRQLLQPKLVGDAMGLNPLATLVFMYLGFRFSGVAGMILAVPVGMMVIELYHVGVFDGFLYNCSLLIKGINDFRNGAEEEGIRTAGSGSMTKQAGEQEKNSKTK